MNEPSPKRARASWTIVLSVLVAAVALPVGVQAATQLVSIKDPDSRSKVQVDRGSLRVGDGNGSLTVDGDVSVDNPVRPGIEVGEPVSASVTLVMATNEGGKSDLLYHVPDGQRLIVENISARGRLLNKYEIARLTVDSRWHIPMSSPVVTGSQSGFKWSTGMAEVDGVLDGSYDVYAYVERGCPETGCSAATTTQVDVSLTGYLVPEPTP